MALDFVKKVYEALQKKLLKCLQFETLDSAVLGDVKRLARVPFSVHEKTSKICSPISFSHKFMTPRTLEIYREYGLDTNLLEPVCRELVAQKKWEEIRAKKKRTRKFNKTEKIRPCIETALSLPLHTGTGHKMRIAIASEYLHKGASVDQVVELFKPQVDFGDGSKTRYYVQEIAMKRHRPFKCSTIRQLGFCLGEPCSTYNKKYGDRRK
jgi:hypothetical protein